MFPKMSGRRKTFESYDIYLGHWGNEISGAAQRYQTYNLRGPSARK